MPPIDPRIPLGADIGPQVDPFKAFDYALRMRQAKRLEQQDAIEAQYRQQALMERQQEIEAQRQQREEEQKAKQEFNATMQRVFESGEPSSQAVQQELVKAGRADLFLKIEPHLRGFDEARKAIQDKKLDAAKNIAATIHEFGNTPEALEQARPFFRAAGWSDDELAPYLQAAQQDPQSIAFMTRTLAGDKIKPKPAATGDFTLGPGQIRYSAEGQELARGLERSVSEQEVKPGSFEDYVMRVAQEKGKPPQALTTAEIEQARKRYQQADDRAPVTVRMQSGMTPGQEFSATRQLRNDYNRETTAARTVQQQLALMKSSLDAVRKGAAPAGSQGVLVTFQKILDPTSVVRESEYARSASGLSLIGRLEGSWMKIQQGGAGVTVKDLEQFVNLADQFAKNQKTFADQSRSQIDAIAKRYGLEPGEITRDVAPPETAAPAGVERWERGPDGKLRKAK